MSASVLKSSSHADGPLEKEIICLSCSRMSSAFFLAMKICKASSSTEPELNNFLNIDKISKIDGRFGIPEKIEDPMLSLFLGGVINQLNASSYSGLTLNFDGKNLNFSVRVDKESDAGNVDLIICETMSSIYEGIIAASTAKNYSDKVFITSLYFFKDRDMGLFLSLIYPSGS